MTDKKMKQIKCPRCSYPLVKKLNLLDCDNCLLFIHERDIYIADFNGHALHLGTLNEVVN